MSRCCRRDIWPRCSQDRSGMRRRCAPRDAAERRAGRRPSQPAQVGALCDRHRWCLRQQGRSRDGVDVSHHLTRFHIVPPRGARPQGARYGRDRRRDAPEIQPRSRYGRVTWQVARRISDCREVLAETCSNIGHPDLEAVAQARLGVHFRRILSANTFGDLIQFMTPS